MDGDDFKWMVLKPLQILGYRIGFRNRESIMRDESLCLGDFHLHPADHPDRIHRVFLGAVG